MTPSELQKSQSVLTQLLATVTEGLGRPERRAAMQSYVTGLVLDGERKSIQPMASRLAGEGENVEAVRQRLQQCVAVASWDEKVVYKRIVSHAVRSLPRFDAYVVDDTGIPKKGTESPGVARQYSGTLGRIDNCQVVTSVHLASESRSICVGMRLFLPQEWTDDKERCARVSIPDGIEHQTKAELSLELLDEAIATSKQHLPVLADAGYGNSLAFRQALRKRGLHYMVAIDGSHLGWPPGAVPKVPPPTGRSGRPFTRDKVKGFKPLPLRDIAETLTPRKVTWRVGSKGKQSGWFAATRVYSAENHHKRAHSTEEIWLVAQWRADSDKPTHFYASSLPATATLRELIAMLKLRWRVERDYQEMKSEVGLDHYEGRTWSGIHHHFVLCAVAHYFLALLRESFSP